MWRYLIYCSIYLLSTSLPLMTTIGANLEYEYTLASAYLILLLMPSLGIILPLKYFPTFENRYAPAAGREALWIFLIAPVVSLLPAFYMFRSGLCPCSGTGFLFWMFIQWYPALILSHALHHGIIRLRLDAKVSRPRLSLGLFAFYALALVVVGVQLWFAPQKRLTTLVFGFWHGPIYDNWIPFDTGILLARSAHLALATTLLLVCWIRHQTHLIVIAILSAGSWIVLAGFASTFPSTWNGSSALGELLPRTIEGQGFTLHYRNDRPGGSPQRVPLKILRAHRDAQFHIGELRKTLGDDAADHVDIYVYPSRNRKKLWFGGGDTDVTDVQTPSIHITANTWPHRTLRHELVHALSSSFGFYGLGFHPNIAFTEGLAEALAPRARRLSLHQGAASLIHSGRLPHIESLFSASFWQQAGARAYTTAGSLIEFLIANYGFQGVKELYSGSSWKKSFGEDRDKIIQSWRNFVRKEYNPDAMGVLTEALFRYPGVLRSLCPHSKAALSRKRSESVYVRLRQPIGWNPQQDYLAWRLKLNPDDKSSRLAVWRREIKKVASDRFSAKGRIETWITALQRARSRPVKTLEDVDMMILESDLLRVANRRDESLVVLDELNDIRSQRFLGPERTRRIVARQAIEKVAQTTMGGEWRRYLAGWRRQPPEIPDEKAPWILRYLWLRSVKPTSLSVEVMLDLLTVEVDPGFPKTFGKEWYRILSERLMRREAYGFAAEAYRKAITYCSESERKLYEEHWRRADYFAEKGSLRGGKAKSAQY